MYYLSESFLSDKSIDSFVNEPHPSTRPHNIFLKKPSNEPKKFPDPVVCSTPIYSNHLQRKPQKDDPIKKFPDPVISLTPIFNNHLQKIPQQENPRKISDPFVSSTPIYNPFLKLKFKPDLFQAPIKFSPVEKAGKFEHVTPNDKMVDFVPAPVVGGGRQNQVVGFDKRVAEVKNEPGVVAVCDPRDNKELGPPGVASGNQQLELRGMDPSLLELAPLNSLPQKQPTPQIEVSCVKNK